MLGICATFSATTPLAQTKKGGARRGGAKAKNGLVAVAPRKNDAYSRHFRANKQGEIRRCEKGDVRQETWGYTNIMPYDITLNDINPNDINPNDINPNDLTH